MAAPAVITTGIAVAAARIAAHQKETAVTAMTKVVDGSEDPELIMSV
jgi:hypothetical protein